jgi:hypothetical protein
MRRIAACPAPRRNTRECCGVLLARHDTRWSARLRREEKVETPGKKATKGQRGENWNRENTDAKREGREKIRNMRPQSLLVNRSQ